MSNFENSQTFQMAKILKVRNGCQSVGYRKGRDGSVSPLVKTPGRVKGLCIQSQKGSFGLFFVVHIFALNVILFFLNYIKI